MASYTLVVDVVSANDLPGSRGSLNPSIELRFAGQKCSTSVSPKEENCRHVWNETITFSALDENKISNGRLEAYVYDDTAGRKSFVGRVQIPGSSFAGFVEVDGDYPLRGGVFPRSKGTLQLKVLLKKERPIATSDPLSAVIPPNWQQIKAEDAKLTEINPTFEHGMIVEHMPYVFVRVVKARHLPGADARGKLDTYVRVKVGGCRSGRTKLMSVEPNAEWNSTFAFSKLVMDREHVNMVYVTVYNKDKAKDDFVGMVWFDVRDIPERTPPSDKPLVPEWYPLGDERGNEAEGELMLAVWMGSLADEAFPHAYKFDSCMGPKEYNLPRLWYLRVDIIEFTCVAVEGETKIVELDVTARLGNTVMKTREKKEPLGRHFFSEKFMFVAAEPFEDGLQISVQARPADRLMVIGEITIPIETFPRRVDFDGIEPRWFDLKIPTEAQSVDGGTDDKLIASSCRILLGNCLEGGYSVICDSTDDNADDLRPAAMDIPDPPTVGLLEIGILGAQSLCPRRRANGVLKVHPYCVAKYGRKWVRTRTIINTRNPVFNEQYAWNVYDTATVLTIGVFDNAEREGYSSEEDNSIGKVRIRLSKLQPDRTYANSYPLLVLTPMGLEQLGELRLALRFSAESIVKMLRMYTSPKLPEMHYKYPISIMEADNLRQQAVGIVAARFSRMEPPLRKEVVEYMCDVGSHDMWSLRKSKANFYRAISAFSFLVMFARWFDGVRLWRKPATTLLVHAMFVMLVFYPELIIPAGLLYIFFITARNYRRRPRYPPHFDIVLSHSLTELIHADELDEEFDLVPTSRDFDIVRMRYDRLRCVAGRVQTYLGNSAKYAERIQLLASWRDTTATTIFGLFTLTTAAVLYFVPWKILVALSGLYTMRHPMLRRKKTPSYLWNFFLRLPHKADALI